MSICVTMYKCIYRYKSGNSVKDLVPKDLVPKDLNPKDLVP